MSFECDELSQMTDVIERIDHELLGCIKCAELKMQKKKNLATPNVAVIELNQTKNLESNNASLSLSNVKSYNTSLSSNILKPNDAESLSNIVKSNNTKASNLLTQTIKPCSSSSLKISNFQQLQSAKTEKDKTKRKYDKLAIRDLSNLKGISRAQAALSIIEERRKRPKMDKNDQKTNVPADQMPWQPGSKNRIMFPPNSHSALDFFDHRRYIAIISNFLTPNPSFRFDLNKLELQGLDERLKTERQKFNDLSIKHVQQMKISPYYVRIRGCENLFIKREKLKIMNLIGGLSFKKVINKIVWPIKLSENVMSGTYSLKILKVFEEGHVQQVQIPNVRRKCQYYQNSQAIEDYLNENSQNKKTIEKDETAIKYSIENNIENIIDASTLRHFLVDPWPFRQQKFINRISVIRRVQNGYTHRVCAISKPILNSPLNLLHVNRQFTKWSVKREIQKKFVKQRTFSNRAKNIRIEQKALFKKKVLATNNSTIISSKNEPKQCQANKSDLKPTTAIVSKMCLQDEKNYQTLEVDNTKNQENVFVNFSEESEEDTKLEIADDEYNLPSPKKLKFEEKIVNEEKYEVNKTEKVENSEKDDLLGNILNSMGLPTTNFLEFGCNNVENEMQKNELSQLGLDSINLSLISNLSDYTDKSNNQNYRYSTLCFDKCAKHMVILRSMNHGIDQNGKNISFTVKTEYLPEIGSQKFFEEEILWNWITACLKGSMEHLIIQIYPRNGNCLQLRRFDPKRVFNEFPQQLKQKIWFRIQRFCLLLDELEKLELGEYLLVQENEKSSVTGEDEIVYKILSENDLLKNKSFFENESDFNLPDELFKYKHNENELKIIDDENEIEKKLDFSNLEQKIYDCNSIINSCQFNLETPFYEQDRLKIWTGIEEHIPLVWQVVQGWIPGTFLPLKEKSKKELIKKDKLLDSTEINYNYQSTTGWRKRRKNGKKKNKNNRKFSIDQPPTKKSNYDSSVNKLDINKETASSDRAQIKYDNNIF